MASCSDNIGVTITWMGHSMFQVDFFQGPLIVTDPYSLETGYESPYVEPDIVTISHYHHDHGNLQAVGGSPEIIDKPGAYDYSENELSITGKTSYHDEEAGMIRGESLMFMFDFKGLSLVHMGDYGQLLRKEHTRFLKDVDIMLIPVGGAFTIGPIKAVSIVKEIKPRIVIPMHYRTEHYKREDVETYRPFADKMLYVRRKGSSVFIEKARLPKETEVWVMEYKQKD